MGWKLSLPEHALEHRVDVAQLAVEMILSALGKKIM